VIAAFCILRLGAFDNAVQKPVEIGPALVETESAFCRSNGIIEEPLSLRDPHFGFLEAAIGYTGRIKTAPAIPRNVIADIGAKIAHPGNGLLVNVIDKRILRGLKSGGDAAEFPTEDSSALKTITTNPQPVSDQKASKAKGESPKGDLTQSDIHLLINCAVISSIIGLLIGYFGTAFLDRRGLYDMPEWRRGKCAYVAWLPGQDIFPWTRRFIRLRVLEFVIFRLHFLQFKIHFLQRLLELRMALNKTRIVCLKRGYFTGNESNLRSNGVLFGVAVHHPVEIINIFLECFHEVLKEFYKSVSST
jgi:hypothetical protein